jgi:hypothetical protein
MNKMKICIGGQNAVTQDKLYKENSTYITIHKRTTCDSVIYSSPNFGANTILL